MIKKQIQDFAFPDLSSEGPPSNDPIDADFDYRYIKDKHKVFASTVSSEPSGPGRAYTHYSYDSDSSSVVLPVDLRRPLSNVPTSEYYKHIPSHWTDEQKIRQLLAWIMEKEADVESSPEIHVTPEAKRARLIANKLKQKIIKDMKEGKMDVSIYNRPDKMEEVEEKENPINVANADKFEALTKAGQSLLNEMEDWKSTTGQIYQAHAEAMDAAPEVDTVVPYEEIDVDFMLEHLPEKMQQFYEEYCVTPEEMDRREFPTELIDHGVTHIRQQLNTVNQFQLKAGKAIDKKQAQVAKALYESGQYLPETRNHSRMDHLEAALRVVLSIPPQEDTVMTDD